MTIGHIVKGGGIRLCDGLSPVKEIANSSRPTLAIYTFRVYHSAMNTSYVLNGINRAIEFCPKFQRANVSGEPHHYVRYDFYSSTMLTAQPTMTLIMEKTEVKILFNFAQSARVFNCENEDEVSRVQGYLQAVYQTLK